MMEIGVENYTILSLVCPLHGKKSILENVLLLYGDSECEINELMSNRRRGWGVGHKVGDNELMGEQDHRAIELEPCENGD